MKFIFSLLLVATIAGCSKNNSNGKYCYTCEFGYSPGGTIPPPKDTCSDTPANTFKFRDAAGNDLSFSCQPK